MNVLHNSAKSRFEVQLADGSTAVLDYRLNSPRAGTLSIIHTYVPPAFERRGVAGRMTKEALAYADNNNLEVVPLCSFAVAYIARREHHRSRPS